ncbi:hypothetical protein HDU91_002906 [Kappamyces sp. JEL0680]|nr:hypothetical protein HDU91_002906 [Kappamyces sp. JEL0680]
MAAGSPDAVQVVGMHFMNPVPVMKLVEIIPGLSTSQDTLQKTLELAKGMGKITTQSKDVPGFIANRVLMPYINEACFVLQEGPLTLADFIGLDTCLAIMRVLHTQLGDDKYRYLAGR